VNSQEKIKNKRSDEAYPPVSQHHRTISRMETMPFPYTLEDLAEAYEQEKFEYEDSPEEIRAKARQILEVIRKANHCVCYTGAGISTSAKIPDFRGPNGVWTSKEKGREAPGVSDITTVLPTFAHYSLTHLVKMGLIRFIVSSNVDGLHLRSGLPPHKLVECHGNIYKEMCETCEKVYYRQYIVENVGLHHTGWRCDWCNGRLRDTHVGFGENVGETDLGISLFHARKSDVSFILGTSMNVQPSVAFQLQSKKNGGKIILVNLQKTPYDSEVDIQVFARTDDFMKIFMEELEVKTFDQATDVRKTWDVYDQQKAPDLFRYGTKTEPGYTKFWPVLAAGSCVAALLFYRLYLHKAS